LSASGLDELVQVTRCPGQTRTATTRNPSELQNAATRSWIDNRAALVDLELELVSRTYAEGVSH
jgi:hypothetical protein